MFLGSCGAKRGPTPEGTQQVFGFVLIFELFWHMFRFRRRQFRRVVPSDPSRSVPLALPNGTEEATEAGRRGRSEASTMPSSLCWRARQMLEEGLPPFPRATLMAELKEKTAVTLSPADTHLRGSIQHLPLRSRYRQTFFFPRSGRGIRLAHTRRPHTHRQ